jgi:hypothetical protein
MIAPPGDSPVFPAAVRSRALSLCMQVRPVLIDTFQEGDRWASDGGCRLGSASCPLYDVSLAGSPLASKSAMPPHL